jgi:hypothetical protein
MAQNPDAGPTAIMDGLKAQGVKVSAALVSAVKYSKKPKGRGRRGRKRRVASVVGSAPTAAQTSAAGLSVSELLDAKRLTDQLGGLAQAKQALETLEQLR